MSTKTAVWGGFFLGSTIGSVVPYLLGWDIFSGLSILISMVCGILGIWAGYYVGQNYF